MSEKHTCSAIVNNNTSRQIIFKMINSMSHDICGCSAKYFEDGTWYCGRHAPSKIKERELKSYEKWKAEMEKKNT
jgi:hypothetical protein